MVTTRASENISLEGSAPAYILNFSVAVAILGFPNYADVILSFGTVIDVS